MQYCTFTVADLFFAVPVEQVQEVIRFQQLTRVPLAPPEVGGLINLRGQIITAIDLRCLLRLPQRSQDASAMNVMLTVPDGIISLLVDQIEDVIDVNEDSVELPPETVGLHARGFIKAASKAKDRLLLMLDVLKATEIESQ